MPLLSCSPLFQHGTVSFQASPHIKSIVQQYQISLNPNFKPRFVRIRKLSGSCTAARSSSPSGARFYPARAKKTTTMTSTDQDTEVAPLMIDRSPSPDPKDSDVDYLRAALLFLFPAIGGLLFGYDIGATSGALVSITSPEYSGTDWYQLSALQSGLVVSLSLAGALLGSGAAFFFGDKLGRKKELMAAAGLYAGSSLLLPLAPTLSTVLFARLVFGLGIGLAMHAAPAYIAETSPAKVRGLLISLKEAFVVGGILAGYAASYLFVGEEGGWRYMYGVAALPAALLAGGMMWLPESPRWLLLSGAREGEVKQALWKCRGGAATEQGVESELSLMKAAIARTPVWEGTGGFGFGELMSERYRRPLSIGVSLMLFQQITGQPSVLYYAASIFQAAGFSSPEEATQVSLWLGVFKLVMTGVAVATVDSWGRRPLLLAGVSGIVLSLLALGSAGSGLLLVGDLGVAYANLAALLVYVGAYQMSFGPISWLMVGEVFPLKVRGQAIALATITNFASNFAVSLALPSIQETVGQSATYFVFAGIGVVALATIYNIVPETKGKTLEQIEALWSPGAEKVGGVERGGVGGNGSGPQGSNDHSD